MSERERECECAIYTIFDGYISVMYDMASTNKRILTFYDARNPNHNGYLFFQICRNIH